MHAGDFREALRHSLPGIGPYTRSAVRIFSFNERDILIETNIRTALMRHFARSTLKVSDSTLLVYARKIAKKQDPRKWHWALMDYGAYLKKTGVRNNSRSVHYVKQSKFEGSLRQMRGEILRQLHAGKQPRGDERMTRALSSLARDGLIVRQKGKWRIA
ncbi:MAG: putative A/G-specific adenine glycosylase [Candidatus Parcubacteria bacterium]